MGIKLNGVEITSNKLNNSDVTLESLDGVKVWPTIVMAEIWKQTTNTNFTTTLELFSDIGDYNYDPAYQGCATPSYLLSQLNSRRPATSEAVGTIIRVNNNADLSLIGGGTQWCSTYMYYEAIGEAVIDNKKWVLIGEYTSQSGYTPFYEITSSGEQPTAELMEQKFPASNYNVGHFGEIQWWDNFYVFQVQEV